MTNEDRVSVNNKQADNEKTYKHILTNRQTCEHTYNDNQTNRTNKYEENLNMYIN